MLGLNRRRSTTVAAHRAVRSVLEGLESRLCLDATYHQLSAGQFTQKWSTTSLITANNNWNGVPSIIGYGGNDITTTIGADPQTLLAFAGPVAAPVPVINVQANQTNPNTNTTGGNAEFEITNPVVAFQGSATSDAPFLLIHLNTTGQTNIPVSYNLRDIDGSADNAVQPVAVQYRIGESGDFVNIPAGFVADASTGPSLADLVTPVSFTLPAAAEGQAQVQLRIITANATGSDEWIGVDDIVIGSVPPANQLQFSASGYSVNEAAGTATITLSRTGADLSAASTVQYATVGGGTATSGIDFTDVSGIATFDPNATSTFFTIPITNDSDPETPETVNLQLSAPTTNGILGAPVNATLTIIDNDTPQPTGLLLNEVSVNPPGTDQPFEYIELRGGAGQSLLNVYAISVEGDGTAAGLADLVFNLSGNSIGTSGLLAITAPSGGHSIPSGTTVVTSPFLDVGTTQSLENGANSFIVVFSPAPIVQGSDLDTNNDGTLDLPAGAVFLDGAGYKDGLAGTVYGADLTPPPVPPAVTQPFTPDAITRFPNNTTPLDPNAWYSGDLQTLLGQGDVNYDLVRISTNAPVGAVITPGAANFGGGGDITPPTVDAGSFNFNIPAQSITLTFSEDVSASLVASDVVLLNRNTNVTVPASAISLAYNGATNIATLTFPTNTFAALDDGNYRLTLPAGSVQDAAGNLLAGDYNLEFFAFSGDANRDRSVDIGDFSTVAANFNNPGTFSQGDFNYSGTVEIGDFSILAAKFNTALPALRPAAPAAGGVFSASPIDKTVDAIRADVLA